VIKFDIIKNIIIKNIIKIGYKKKKLIKKIFLRRAIYSLDSSSSPSPLSPHFPHLSLRLRFVTANNRYLPGYLGQHMPSSERLGADEHQMKIYRYNFELWLTGPIVMRMRGYPEFEVDSLAIK
jgi:hypothetical protein